MTAEEIMAEGIMAITPNNYGWRVLPNGNYVKLGDCVKLGDGMTSIDLVRQIIAALPDTMTATKWVTRDRVSPLILALRFSERQSRRDQ